MNRCVAVFREDFLPPSETFVRDHLLGLRRFEPVVVTRAVRADPLVVPGVAVRSATSTNRWAHRFSGAQRRLFRRDGAAQEALAYARIFRRLKPDLVHAHFGTDGAVILPIVKAAGLPLLVTFHGWDATVDLEVLATFPGSAAALAASIPKMWSELAGVVAVSSYIRESIIARGADPKRVEVIPCGVDTRVFAALPPASNNDLKLLFIGRLVEKKGCIDLLEAMAGMAKAPALTIIGEGPLRGELERFAADHRLPVTFVGAADQSQIRRHLMSADAVAMPSKRASNGDSEGLPVVSLEAGASARPVIGYAHSGLTDSVVDGSTGLLAQEGDVSGLRRHLETIATDRDLAHRLGVQAREHVRRNFEQAGQLRRLEDFYERVILERGPAGTHR